MVGSNDGVMRVSIFSESFSAGKFLGKAFDIPRNMIGEVFFAAVVLKVDIHYLLISHIVVCG